VDDLLDVSRITRGKVTLARELLDLSTIINRAVETSRPLIDERRHKLTVAFPPEPARVEGDLTRLVQVVGNLLNNAAKYTDEGRQIWLEAAEEGDEAVIRVRDNGMGISADLLPHVFALFTQAERSLDRSHGGLGIGLTLVRHLVEMHGGRVEARSEGPGRGSEFIVRLPALAQGSAADTKEAIGERARPASGALKILVVEDNVDSAESMALLLRLNGHEVRIAHDGSSALAEAHSFVPQVVLCDIGLPGMDGYEVAARLREQEAFKQTPLIALTGYGQDESRRRAKEAGFDYHLVKPVEPGALNTVLNSPLSNGRAQ
jgi:CheY-like chemotaxis protein